MVTDPISNMIISMKNGALVSKKTVVVPFSKLKHAIAQCLKEQGYVTEVSKKTEKNNVPVLEITLAYTGASPRIHDVKRMSKPSRRTYLGVHDIRGVKNGHGMVVLSTPKGILTDKQARKEMVGGEALFMIW
ncbi:MAG: 30S ribosomal protein S8 [Candidatus Pacebacteria bacterium]|jgi:small subunit ribosomal protein S8|nr:30S ribosomal protein S8 [Candidatus Paceibacterota bacterium]MBP9700986.1 30S ribosomal protein S8 [Candidatus Paceibacterota bacterium]